MLKSRKLVFILRFVAVSLAVGAFAVIASAQCDNAAETTLYNKFLENYKGSDEQKKTANDLGKDYVAKFGECPTDEEKKVTAFLQKWIQGYKDDLIKRQNALIESNCVNAVNNTPSKAFELCQPLLARDPESLRTHLLLS